MELSQVHLSEDARYTLRFSDLNEKAAMALFQIRDATAEDYETKYICRVTNTVGQAQREFSLDQDRINEYRILIYTLSIHCLFTQIKM